MSNPGLKALSDIGNGIRNTTLESSKPVKKTQTNLRLDLIQVFYNVITPKDKSYKQVTRAQAASSSHSNVPFVLCNFGKSGIKFEMTKNDRAKPG